MTKSWVFGFRHIVSNIRDMKATAQFISQVTPVAQGWRRSCID